MDFQQIQDLIKLVDEKELTELKIKSDGFKISIRSKHYNKNGGNHYQTIAAAPMSQMLPLAQQSPPQVQSPAQPVATSEATASTNGETSGAEDSEYVTIKSPMIGTFYRSPGPDKDPFVKVGDTIEKGNVLCIVEAMKLFNEIESEQTGKIIKVLVEDASPVEYDQPLFLIAP